VLEHARALARDKRTAHDSSRARRSLVVSRAPLTSPLHGARAERRQVITVFRAVQLGLSATGDPGLTMLGTVALAPTWFVSTAFNLRFLASQQKREQGSTRDSARGLVQLHKVLITGREGSAKPERVPTPWGMGGDVEVGRVEVELLKD
jgi:hypothetical protein